MTKIIDSPANFVFVLGGGIVAFLVMTILSVMYMDFATVFGLISIGIIISSAILHLFCKTIRRIHAALNDHAYNTFFGMHTGTKFEGIAVALVWLMIYIIMAVFTLGIFLFCVSLWGFFDVALKKNYTIVGFLTGDC